ncbi:YggS family pyridoxal phosphate-dependent enzyme [Neptunicella marina]|uniref:Pyridoxal phosphate homeostasis protein n=1 Tax=Neptunicella marina TaxID=2125989 RepID=A0A8J6J0V8_9ALTE|nr:YggS family pyridoxal phosphate-dependent enzyme [Neptunicella marina]MBC3767820.1 YggS family pyridoxal phosphate-dependent enzyme [Neptunicella marina]
MKTIAEQLQSVYQAIHSFCSSNATAQEVSLLAVSKKHPADAIRQAYNAGQRQFGENYAQEGAEKKAQLADLSDIEWHFIGPVQSNKTQLIVDTFNWVQSVDRGKIARRLSKQRSPALAPLQICLQVNISGETTKSGMAVSEVFALAEQVDALPNLTLRGLMCIGSDNPAHQQQEFTRMQQLFEELKQQYKTVDTLSMGMSGDWQQAINYGATMIRLGTAIFGSRQ